MSLKSDLVCNICKKILKEPVTLPCLCAEVCQQHIDDIVTRRRTHIQCQTCEKVLDVPKQGFPPNLVVKKYIERDGHLTHDEKQLKKDLQHLLTNLEDLITKFRIGLAEITLLHCDHYAELRRQIDIRRETLLTKINQISQAMIARVESSEAAFKKNSLNRMFNLAENELENASLNAVLDIFRDPVLVTDEVEKLMADHALKAKEIQTHIESIQQMKLDFTSYKFETTLNFDADSFGYLDLNERFQNLITCHFNSCDISVWDLNTKAIVRTLSGHLDGVWCMKIYQSTKLISGSRDKSIRIWNLQTGECIQKLNGHTDEVLCLKVLQNDFLASGSNDESIKIWSILDGCLINTLNGHSSWVYCLEQLPNGNLVSGSNDNNIKIWELASGTCIKTLESHTDWVSCVRFFSGDRLVSGSADNTVKIWNYNSGECLQTLYGHSSLITDLELTASSNQIVSSSYDKRIKIWNLTDGNFIQTLTGHKSFVNCIRVNSDGKLYSGSEDKTIRVWNVKTNECIEIIKGNLEISDLELTTIF